MKEPKLTATEEIKYQRVFKDFGQFMVDQKTKRNTPDMVVRHLVDVKFGEETQKMLFEAKLTQLP